MLKLDLGHRGQQGDGPRDGPNAGPPFGPFQENTTPKGDTVSVREDYELRGCAPRSAAARCAAVQTTNRVKSEGGSDPALERRP